MLRHRWSRTRRMKLYVNILAGVRLTWQLRHNMATYPNNLKLIYIIALYIRSAAPF